MGYIKPREQKVKLPFPDLIYGILSSQGIELYDYELKLKALDSYRVYHKLLKGKHLKDVTLVIPPNATVSVADEEEDNIELGHDKKLAKGLLKTIVGISLS